MNCQNLAEILSEAGAEVIGSPLPAGSLGLPDSARARLLIEMGGLLRVYCAETPGKLPSASGLRSKLEGTGYDSLALVTTDGQEFLAVHVPVGGEGAHRTLSATEVTGLLKGLAGEADAASASDRILELLTFVEKPKAYNNRGLFSDDYLEHRVPESSGWTEDVSAAYAGFRELYEARKNDLTGLDEANTEMEFVEPALALLGFHPIKRAKTKTGGIPDYALFGSAEDKNAASKLQKDSESFYARALAVVEGKYWGRSLDVYTKKEDKRETGKQTSSPEMQLGRYLQETDVSWGLLTNGAEWRLYHGDSVGKVKKYYSVDFERALASEGDFRRFYLFLRRDAFMPKGPKSESFLDWVLEGSEQYAIRVGNNLKEVVFTQVFPQLARGFLEDHTREKRLPADEEALGKIYRGTLALLYRLLFLLYAESRDLLPTGDHLGYGARGINAIKAQVAERLDKKYTYSGGYVLWQSLVDLFGIVDVGNLELKVPPYNGGLFKDEGNHELLGTHRISDRHLAAALDALSRQRGEDGTNRFVDYGFVGVRELGSVYEGLLEFSLRIADEDLVAVKEKGKEVYVKAGAQERQKVVGRVNKGDPYLVNDKKERKATGSYYTPRYIVDYIVENTLGPLVKERRAALEEKLQEVRSTDDSLMRSFKSEEYRAERRRKAGALESLLDVKVLDPAMGSGNFLVAAVDFLTDEFSRLISELDAEPIVEQLAHLRGEIEESLEKYGTVATEEQLSDANLLKRMVLKRCVYGVDQNEMAVELAKLSLWLDAFTVGAPLSFLDHHLKYGNSLIGSSVRKVRHEVESSGTLLSDQFNRLLVQGTELMQQVGEIPDATEGEVRQSISNYRQADKALKPYKRIMDVWTSQHFGNAGAQSFLKDELPSGGLHSIIKGKRDAFGNRGKAVLSCAETLAEGKHFFHWELEFPEVFYEGDRERGNPGFDAVIGNPPYGDILGQADKTFITETGGLKTGGRAEVYAHFITHALANLAVNGQVSFIVPNTSVDGAQFGTFRQHVSREATIMHIRDFRSKRVFQDADVLTMVLRLLNRPGQPTYETTYEYWDKARGRYRESNLEISSDTTLPWQASDDLTDRITRHDMYALLDPDIGSCRDAGVDYKWKNVGWQNRGKRQPLSKVLFYIGPKRSSSDYPLIKGANLNRYHLQHDGDYLVHDFDKYRTEESAVLVYLDLALVPAKILTRQTADRIRAAIDVDRLVTAKSVHTTIVTANGYSEWYVLALLNSKLLSYIYQLRTGEQGRTFAQVKVHDLRRMPIRRISFIADPGQRQRFFTQAVTLCTQDPVPGNEDEVLTFVDSNLPLHDYAVHDLLSHLAEELTTIHRQRASIELTWREWVVAAIPQQKKLKKDFLRVGWVMTGLDKGWPAILAEFQARNAVPSGKALRELKHETEEALGELRPLYKRSKAIDHLIDQTVYRLYGLTEEDISIVEGSVQAG